MLITELLELDMISKKLKSIKPGFSSTWCFNKNDEVEVDNPVNGKVSASFIYSSTGKTEQKTMGVAELVKFLKDNKAVFTHSRDHNN